MFKSFPKISVAAVAIMASASAFAMTEVRSVNVDVDLEAIQNANAAQYWTTVADDLETALVARLAPQLSDEGSSITVDIDELSLANTFQSILGIEKSELMGSVSVNDLTDNSKHQSYDLTVAFEPSPVLLALDEDVTIVTRTTESYYNEMLTVFADRVADKLK